MPGPQAVTDNAASNERGRADCFFFGQRDGGFGHMKGRNGVAKTKYKHCVYCTKGTEAREVCVRAMRTPMQVFTT